MPTVNTDTRYRAIERTLAQCAGDAPDARAVAAASVGIWQQVAAQLAPVIGWRGVHVVFSRAVHVMRKDFPTLLITADREPGAAQFASLRAWLEARTADSAAKASYALLTTFTDLLANLIGESLTDRLLNPVWASPPASEQENAR